MYRKHKNLAIAKFEVPVTNIKRPYNQMQITDIKVIMNITKARK
jgi:hypothetical protein